MNCPSCQAHIAPASSHCFFCGADLHANRAPGTAGAGLRFRGLPAENEGWRIWLSWLLFGLYAPVVGSFLFEREEWNASLRADSLPPTAPSQRGLFVLGIVLFAPLIAILALSYTVQSLEYASRWNHQPGDSPVILGLINLAIASIPAFGTLSARSLQRRFELLLTEITGGDPIALVRFRQGARHRFAIALVAWSSMSLIGLQLVMMVSGTGGSEVFFTPLYMFSLLLAPWASSWLNIEPAMRFRRVMAGVP